MTLYEKALEEFRKNKDVDIIYFMETLQPLTPQEIKLEMKDVNDKKLKTCVMYNIHSQHLKISSEATELLFDFMEKSTTSFQSHIYLQVLLHLVKVDVNTLQNCYEEKDPGSPEDLYTDRLVTFLKTALAPHSRRNLIEKVSEQLEKKIKTALLSKVVMRAVITTLDLIKSQIPEDAVIKAILEMDIYRCEQFAPIAGLRGVCLTSGILLCETGLAQPGDSFCYEADMITLAVHESMHFIARLATNNFNFSSLFSFDLFHRESKISDPADKKFPLELGRAVELELFEGQQPSWRRSSEKAARLFLKRLDKYVMPPVIKKEEFEEIGFKPRKKPSPGFGIDLEELPMIYE